MRCFGLVALIFSVSFSTVSAAVKLPAIFSDHAVLAKKAVVPVFGKAEPGERVNVEFNGQRAMSIADRNGKWRVNLNLANSPEGPFELKVNDIIIKDVIVGEVWLCSGQSNMAWLMNKTEGLDEAKKKPIGSRLRSFNMPKKSYAKPTDLWQGQWVYADPQNVGSFSGVGYFFGRKLLAELNTPVGLINDAWGGSPIETWMSRDAAKVVPAVAERDAKTSLAFKKYPEARKKYIAALETWAKKNKRQDTPHKVPGADAKWKTVTAVSTGNSVTWIRRKITTAASNIVFSIPRQRIPFTVWLDGKKVHERTLDEAIRYVGYNFTVKNTTPGTHEMMIRVYNPLNISWNFNLSMSVGGTNIDGAVWDMYREVTFRNRTSQAPKSPGATPREFFNTQRVFNGCIYGLLPYALDGVIWYQGETNAGRHNEYAALKKALIKDWRQHFEFPELPFLWCTLAGHYKKNANAGAEENFAWLRQAQTEALELPFTGQAVLTDICETNDIHPRNKVVPGERLAAIALANVYGKKVPYAGPSVVKVVPEGGKLRIFFKDIEGGLAAHPVANFYWVKKRVGEKKPFVRNSPDTQLEGFAVCGKDGKWVWADEAVIDGDTVVVSSKKVAEPVRVRYAWQNNPTCNLYNKAGFPAVPFMQK